MLSEKTTAEEIAEGLCYLLIRAKALGVRVDTCAEHDVFYARIGVSYDFENEELVATINKEMEDLGWCEGEDGTLSYSHFT